jgi:hypothetical protein
MITMSAGLFASTGSMLGLILVIAALVCFGLAAFSVVVVSRLNLVALGLFLLTLDLLIG